MSTRNTDFPIPKSELYYYDEVEKVLKPLVDVDGLMKVNIENSDIMQPIEVQGHLQQTIQTHAGVVVTPSGTSSNANWIDTAGFDRVAITYTNDANASNSTDILWSHDGVNYNSIEWVVLGTSSVKERAIEIPTKARYMKVRLTNSDANAPHTMSAWVYLKA